MVGLVPGGAAAMSASMVLRVPWTVGARSPMGGVVVQTAEVDADTAAAVCDEGVDAEVLVEFGGAGPGLDLGGADDERQALEELDVLAAAPGRHRAVTGVVDHDTGALGRGRVDEHPFGVACCESPSRGGCAGLEQYRGALR